MVNLRIDFWQAVCFCGTFAGNSDKVFVTIGGDT